MKINFDIECTPQEARQFLGLPNVEPMQEALMKELEERMRESMSAVDAETMLKTWLPATIQGWGEVQKMFWGQMGMGDAAASGPFGGFNDGVKPASEGASSEASSKASGRTSGKASGKKNK